MAAPMRQSTQGISRLELKKFSRKRPDRMRLGYPGVF